VSAALLEELRAVRVQDVLADIEVLTKTKFVLDKLLHVRT